MLLVFSQPWYSANVNCVRTVATHTLHKRAEQVGVRSYKSLKVKFLCLLERYEGPTSTYLHILRSSRLQELDAHTELQSLPALFLRPHNKWQREVDLESRNRMRVHETQTRRRAG
jgi:hypothetical protein